MFFWIIFALHSLIKRYRKNIIIFTGFTFSIAVLVFLGAVMTGVNDTMIKNALTLHTGYIVVEGGGENYSDALKKADREKQLITEKTGEKDILTRISIPAIIMSGENSAPVFLTCIKPDEEKKITPIHSKVREGKYLEDSENSILISSTLSEKTGAKTGDTVKIFSPILNYSASVSGIYSTGIESFDTAMIFTDANNIRTFIKGKIQYQLSIFLENSDILKNKINEIRQYTESVKGWDEKLPDIYQLVKLNRLAMYIMIFLVILIIGFSVANTLVTSVIERKKTFSILKALGSGEKEIALAIFSESLILTALSGIAGTAAGIFAVYITTLLGGIDLSTYTSFNPNFAINSIIIPRITPEMTLFPVVMALASGTAASLIPAVKTAKQKVVSGMRNI